MPRQEIDLTTPQPNGKMGEPTKSAWEKVNDMTAEIYAGIEASSQLAGRNMLINCGVPINQRGFAGGALAAGAYGYDRWKAGAGGCNVTINASTGVFTHTSGPIQQIVEAPQLAWGQPLTISVENPSGSITVSVGGATGTITSGTGRRGVTLTPSGSGNMTVQLTVAGVTYYSRPQLEIGSVATAFEYRLPGLELALCQRYYQKSLPVEVAPSPGAMEGLHAPAVAWAATAARVYQQFRVDMRVAPSVTIYRGSDANSGNNNGICLFNNGSWSNSTSPASVSGSRTTGFQVDATATFSMTLSSTYLAGFHWVADAEI